MSPINSVTVVVSSQVWTSVDMSSATGVSSVLAPLVARARTASRSLKMPTNGGVGPVTTRAPMPRSFKRTSASFTVRSWEIVATSWFLFAKRFETCTTTSLSDDDQSEPDRLYCGPYDDGASCAIGQGA